MLMTYWKICPIANSKAAPMRYPTDMSAYGGCIAGFSTYPLASSLQVLLIRAESPIKRIQLNRPKEEADKAHTTQYFDLVNSNSNQNVPSS